MKNKSFYEAVERRLAASNRRGAAAAVGAAVGPTYDQYVQSGMPPEGFSETQVRDAVGRMAVDTSQAPRTGPADPQYDLKIPKATPVGIEQDPERMAALFKKATGTDFDAKSSLDKKAMAEINEVIGGLRKKGADLTSMSDTDIALEWYRSKNYGSKTGRRKN